MAERIFCVTITNSEDKKVPVRIPGEQHVKEDLGRIPTAADWLRMIKPESWMAANVQKLDFEDMTEQESPIIKQKWPSFRFQLSTELFTRNSFQRHTFKMPPMSSDLTG